jgi:DNA topoisomerase-2
VDGFKDSQRKVIYGMLQHGTSEIKVSQAGSYVAQITHYAHGEASLGSTIVGLAQNFPGSNNVNLLEPIGQFGSILNSASASTRYIFTKHSKFMRKILKIDDDLILESRMEEGINLEPISYFPIIPLWLVNGAVGIGTGHSVTILPRDYKTVVKLINSIISGTTPHQKTIDQAMLPSFNGWKGTVAKGESDSQWILTGKLEKVNTTTIRVTELPVTYGVNKYKDILIGLMDKGIVKDFDNNSNEESFDFVITVPREVGRKSESELINVFKLQTKVGENVTLWNSKGLLQRYDSVYEALQEFISFRLTKYQVRKDKLLELYGIDIRWLQNKAEFINQWNNKLKNPHLMSEDEITKALDGIVDVSYIDRLMALPIRSLTKQKMDELLEQIQKLEKQVETLISTSIEQLYSTDLLDI